ncbi:aldehyde dehydrogenase family protein [Algihabitans albus]|uniref:aldehyde dehydrogenase family protein n=1 Tax=Algihabitans albus TaxID=2164067 RepID=UPI000E5D8A40|nr:aldehyde dehydrogenase family protein [Algihabitans albus]
MELPGTNGAVVETRLFIAGAWRDSQKSFEVRDKYSGDVVASVQAAAPALVSEAVEHCRRAFDRGVPSPYERAEILYCAASLARADQDRLAATYQAETGFTGSDARTETDRCIQTLTLCAEEARRFDANETIPISGAPGPAGRFAFVMRVPIGPVAAITPFNAPLNTVAHKVGPAIAAGNPVLLKPSAHTPLCGALIVDLMLRAGWPADLIALLQGGAEVGQQLLEEPDIRFYTFTGSTDVGRVIQKAAGLRRTQLELGSIAFTIIEPDADLDRALPLVRTAAFRKAGQVCTSVQVLLVQRDVYAEVRDRLVALTETTPFGDPAGADTITGPMISVEAAERAEARIAEAVAAGATILAGGRRDRAVLAPTVLADASPTVAPVCEEMFAPVVTLLPYDTLDEAFERINATPYGLAAGLFTARIDAALQAARGLRVGTVHINNTSSSRVDLMPYGGVKDSGFGREGPHYAMHEMTEERLVTLTP